ncbi:MAG: hypothetical protein ACI8QS_003412 [Planctomycetota bacterium]|jgi:hypothetical protein
MRVKRGGWEWSLGLDWVQSLDLGEPKGRGFELPSDCLPGVMWEGG